MLIFIIFIFIVFCFSYVYLFYKILEIEKDIIILYKLNEENQNLTHNIFTKVVLK